MMGHKVKTRPKVEVAPEQPVARDKCRHYWIIESPNGPTSRGVCKLCGAEKEFQNFFPYSVWEGNLPALLDTDGIQELETDAAEMDDF
jgi:hypothetical protein